MQKVGLYLEFEQWWTLDENSEGENKKLKWTKRCLFFIYHQLLGQRFALGHPVLTYSVELLCSIHTTTASYIFLFHCVFRSWHLVSHLPAFNISAISLDALCYSYIWHHQRSTMCVNGICGISRIYVAFWVLRHHLPLIRNKTPYSVYEIRKDKVVEGRNKTIWNIDKTGMWKDIIMRVNDFIY